ncbi:MAG: hypothetical protein OIF35_00065, partial [Cellvibrionaceae bacterium]|nr:hypothetical protein [Cellvibrionaceae bacterium]
MSTNTVQFWNPQFNLFPSFWGVEDTSEDDTIHGSEADDWLYGSDLADTLYGHAGDDFIFGFDGDDTLAGGAGNDHLYGGLGKDTYLVSAGDGHTVISDYNWDNNSNILKLQGGLSADDINFSREHDDLLVSLTGTDETITIRGQFADFWFDSGPVIGQIEFDDGTILSADEIKNLLNVGTEGDDHLEGDQSDNELYGLGGNDTLMGFDGNDYLNGGAGNDSLWGDQGDDTLDGGAGDDELYGGDGNDTYIVNLGEGDTTIWDNNWWGDANNTLRLGEGISKQDISVSREHYDMVISINNSGQTITVVHQFFPQLTYQSDNYIINAIEFADGSVISAAELYAEVNQASEGDDYLVGDAEDNALSGLGGNDRIAGGDGDDRIDGGAGDDTLYGQSGDDTLYGGSGRDSVYGGLGNDRIYGNAGDDTIYGGDGDDVLRGDSGNDYLEGGEGSDTYLVGKNDGNTIIRDNEFWGEDSSNSLRLLEGIEADDISLSRDVNDLILSNNANASSITIEAYFNEDQTHSIDIIRFHDGTIWAPQDIYAMLAETNQVDGTIVGTEADDELQGGDGDDSIKGLGGDDQIRGGAGNDQLWGGEGNDRIDGEAGSDTVYGGAGDDHLSAGDGDSLHGNQGDDTYLIVSEAGEIFIADMDTEGNSYDTIRFDTLLPYRDDITLERSEDDLIIRVAGLDQSIHIEGQYQQSGDNHIEALEFA